MKFINSALETIKKFWYMFAIVALTGVVLLVGFLENSKVAGISKFVRSLADSYRKQMNAVENLSDKKEIKDKQAKKNLDDKIKKIDDKKEKDLKKIEEDKIKTVEVLKDTSTEELAKKMKEEFKL
jgi:ABC-type amino acid transport substrate-binding protein